MLKSDIDVEAEYLNKEINFLKLKEFSKEIPALPSDAEIDVISSHNFVEKYCEYYFCVGARWLWHERREKSEAIEKLSLRSEMFALRIGQDFAGFFVLSFPEGFIDSKLVFDKNNSSGEVKVELDLFGLATKFIGVSLGRPWLSYAIMRALYHPLHKNHNRVVELFVNTCSFDHPSAIRLYQKAGFELYDSKVVIVKNPLFSDKLLYNYWHQNQLL